MKFNKEVEDWFKDKSIKLLQLSKDLDNWPGDLNDYEAALVEKAVEMIERVLRGEFAD